MNLCHVFGHLCVCECLCVLEYCKYCVLKVSLAFLLLDFNCGSMVGPSPLHIGTIHFDNWYNWLAYFKAGSVPVYFSFLYARNRALE